MNDDKIAYLDGGEKAFADLIEALQSKKVVRVLVAFKVSADAEIDSWWSYVRTARGEYQGATLEDVGAASMLAQYVLDWHDGRPSEGDIPDPEEDPDE